jgi:hypothetical protein
VLGCERVVDGDHDAARSGRERPCEPVVAVEVAEHEAAPVDQDDHGTLFAGLRVIDADRELAGRGVDHAILNAGDGFRLAQILPHGPHSLATCSGEKLWRSAKLLAANRSRCAWA